MVASRTGAPSLADVEILSDPDGVTLPRNFSMACGQWLRMQLIVGTCFGFDHNALDGLKEFGEEMSASEMELEEYTPCDSALRPHIPSLILQHAQIRWSNWLVAQWGKTLEVPFPDLVRLWTAMENQDPWEPTFHARYTLYLKSAYRGVVSTRPNQGPGIPGHMSHIGHLGRTHISGCCGNGCADSQGRIG